MADDIQLDYININKHIRLLNDVTDRLRKRIEELEAALREIADDEQQNWSVDGYGAWTWVGDDDPATIARRALEGGE